VLCTLAIHVNKLTVKNKFKSPFRKNYVIQIICPVFEKIDVAGIHKYFSSKF